MTVSDGGTFGLLEATAARLDQAGYQEIFWDRAERAAIAEVALHRASIALRDGSEVLVHPLGFARIPISTWELNQSRIAIHVWAGQRLTDNALDIHDHCYDFVSICIAGQIRHSFFELSHSADAVACDAWNYRAGCCAESESALGQGQRLALVDEQIVAIHDAMSINHAELHRARPLTDVAITVQFQSTCIKAAARVFREANAHCPTEDESGKDLTRERLALLLERASQ